MSNFKRAITLLKELENKSNAYIHRNTGRITKNTNAVNTSIH